MKDEGRTILTDSLKWAVVTGDDKVLSMHVNLSTAEVQLCIELNNGVDAYLAEILDANTASPEAHTSH